MKSLPMIEFAASLLKDDFLDDCYIIGVQHILPTTFLMFKELFKKGLKPQNLSLLGKCYSTDRSVFEEMLSCGIDVCPSSVEFDSHKPYDCSFAENIHQFLEKRKEKLNCVSNKKIIVLDDGGDLLNAVTGFLECYGHAFGMEQTSSGYHRLKNKSHQLPIINLARARSKLIIEPKRIIDLSLLRIKKYLKNCNRKVSKALIIGNGAIGSKAFQNLKDEYTILRYDLDPERSDITPGCLDQHLNEFDLIIGCTGSTSITENQHKLLKKGCILASFSSSDREFDAVHLRKKIIKTTACFDHLDINGVTLLNCGFPISFDGQDDVDDPEFFQFIRALIISCIAQTDEASSTKGLVDLKDTYQEMIIAKFHSLKSNQKQLPTRNLGIDFFKNWKKILLTSKL
jgi:S-adenosylhomocysteine hydrolase